MDLKNELDLLVGAGGGGGVVGAAGAGKNVNAADFMFPSSMFDLNGGDGSDDMVGLGDYSHFGKFDFFNQGHHHHHVSSSSSSNLLVNPFLQLNEFGGGSTLPTTTTASSSAPIISNPNSCSSPSSSTCDSDHLTLVAGVSARYLTTQAKSTTTTPANNNNNEQALMFLSPPSSTSSSSNTTAALVPTSVNNSNSSSSSSNSISQDDLIDKRDSLWLYYTEFYAKNECAIDSTQGSFVVKQTKLSKSMQRKMFNLHQVLSSKDAITVANMSHLSDEVVNNMVVDEMTVQKMLLNQEYKKKAFRLLRSICERVLIDSLVLVDQYSNQIGAHLHQNGAPSLPTGTTNNTTSSSIVVSSHHTYSKLWAEVRARGCQFLGPQMQEDVLNSILHALNVLGRWSRKNLINYVVWSLKLNKMYEKASRTNVGHVVQILYRAGCFKKLEKREPMMELKKEFTKYAALRKQHDMELIKIALEAGIRLTPEQWSQKFYGDSAHKSEMQSIIDKLQSQQTLDKLIGDVYEKLDQLKSGEMLMMMNNMMNGDVGSLVNIFMKLKPEFEAMAAVNFEKRPSSATAGVSTVSKSSNEESAVDNKLVRGVAATADKTKSTNNSDNNVNFDEDISYEEMDDEIHRGADDFSFDDDYDDEEDDEDGVSPIASTTAAVVSSGDLLDENKPHMMMTVEHQNEVKISWQMLIETLRRTFKILGVYYEFAAKLSAILSATANIHHHHNQHHQHHHHQLNQHGGYSTSHNLGKQQHHNQLPLSQMNRAILKQNVSTTSSSPSSFMLHNQNANNNLDPVMNNKIELYKQLVGYHHPQTSGKQPTTLNNQHHFVNYLPSMSAANLAQQKASSSSSFGSSNSPPVPLSPVFKPGSIHSSQGVASAAAQPPPGFSSTFNGFNIINNSNNLFDNLHMNKVLMKNFDSGLTFSNQSNSMRDKQQQHQQQQSFQSYSYFNK